MATLGKTSIGGTHASAGANTLCVWGPYTAASSGTVTDINFYDPDAQGPTFHLTLGIYADSSGLPGARLAQSGEIGYPSSPGWATASISLAITAGSIYWIGFNSDRGPGWQYDAPGAALEYKGSTYAAGALDNPFGTPDGSLAQDVSIYVNYTPSGGAGVTWLPVTRVVQGQTFDAIDSGFKPPR